MADQEDRPRTGDDDSNEATDEEAARVRATIREQHRGWYARHIRAQAVPPEVRAARSAGLRELLKKMGEPPVKSVLIVSEDDGEEDDDA